MGWKVGLTREQALKIRELYAMSGPGGAGLHALAARYGVSVSTVHNIVKGEHHLVRDLEATPRRGNSFWDRDTRIGRRPLGGERGVTAVRAVKLAASMRPPAGARKERLKVPCPTCRAKSHEPCWSTRGSYPIKLQKLHEDRRVKGAEK